MQREIKNTLNTYLQISVMVNLHLHVSLDKHFTCITFPCTLHPYDNHIYSCIKLVKCPHESIKFI